MDATLIWEQLTSDRDDYRVARAAVPGGWLVVAEIDLFEETRSSGCIFLSDPNHEWSQVVTPGKNK